MERGIKRYTIIINALNILLLPLQGEMYPPIHYHPRRRHWAVGTS